MNRLICFIFLYVTLQPSLLAVDQESRLYQLLLNPDLESLVGETDLTDPYFSLGPEVQHIEKMNNSLLFDAFYQLGSQNNHPYFRHPERNIYDFISKLNRTRYPILFIDEEKNAGLLLGKEVNLWRGLEAFGVIQTNRPPGYIEGDFHTADALDIPRWLTYYLIFAKKLPKRLSMVMEKVGLSSSDYFVIYLMPESYDWAVGERLPLLPFVLPKRLFTERGYNLDQLDFSNAKVVFPQDAILSFEKSGNFRDLAAAGIHIPLKDTNGEEFFMPLSILEKVYKALHSIFLLSVSLADPRNFEELQSRTAALTEDLAADSFYNLREAEEFSSLLSLLMKEVVLHPSSLNLNDRARNRQPSTSGPFSQMTRALYRASENSPSIEFVKKMSGSFKELLEKTKKRLGREPEKTLEKDRREIRESLEKFQREHSKIQSEILGELELDSFQIQRAYEPPPRLPAQAPSDEVNKTRKWLQRLSIGSICALPFATVLSQLLPVISSEWQQITPYAALGSFFSAMTVTGFIWYSYLRNVSIRDAHQQGLLNDEHDPTTAKLLKTAKAEENPAYQLRTEDETLQRRIEERHREEMPNNPVYAAWHWSRRLILDFTDYVKRASIRGWYGFKSLEDRAQEFRNNPQNAQERTALELFGVLMARAYGSIFLAPWHRFAVQTAFPFYFSTRERGGRASLNTWKDWGLWPSPFYVGLRAATYGLGFLWPSFKPDRYWEDLDAERERLIQINSLIEPAISRAVRQLEIAKALELGMDLRIVAAILSVERHIQEEGLAWLENLQRQMPPEKRLSKEALKEIVAYSDEIVHLSFDADLYNRMREYLESLDSDLSKAQKIEFLSAYAKKEILTAFNARSSEHEGYYQHGLRRAITRVSRTRMNIHEKFFRLGKSGENLTHSRTLLALGSYPFTHLQDRLIITLQVVPMIASKSLHTGMTEEDLFNGLAPIFLFLGPDNLQSYGSGLAISSRMIDQLLEGRLRNESTPYAQAIWQSFKHAPWKSLFLQSAGMLDLRILSAANSALLMVGFLYPIDILLSGWNSLVHGQDFLSSVLTKGGGRIANGLAGASINISFSAGSIPFYRGLMLIRRETGGIGSNGYEARSRINPHTSADRILFSGSQAVLNILYGIFAGWGQPLLSARLTDWGQPLLPTETIDLDPTCAKMLNALGTQSQKVF